ncbi:MAG: fasciclin domain-containing protein [Flavobacteriales bacterium]|nr:fasciclin domain-containing protein [Flavobacteriales bacterium]
MKFINYVVFSFALVFATSCANDETKTESKKSETPKEVSLEQGQGSVDDGVSAKNIIQLARATDDLSTLVAGINAAGLNDVLANAGPLTVFAPTNAAFDKLPDGVLDDLLKPENKEKLAAIIKYHAAPGNYDGEHIKRVMGIGQATGEKVVVEIKDGVTYVNGAKVLASVKASNGYVHVIDAVLLPPPPKD